MQPNANFLLNNGWLTQKRSLWHFSFPIYSKALKVIFYISFYLLQHLTEHIFFRTLPKFGNRFRIPHWAKNGFVKSNLRFLCSWLHKMFVQLLLLHLSTDFYEVWFSRICLTFKLIITLVKKVIRKNLFGFTL